MECAGREDDGVMEVVIVFEGGEPPAGVVHVDRSSDAEQGDETRFVGWLGLLRLLEDALRGDPRADG